MITPRFIRHLLNSWDFWRARQKLYRAMPELREQDRLLKQKRRRHQSTRAIEAAKRRIMTARLQSEVAR